MPDRRKGPRSDAPDSTGGGTFEALLARHLDALYRTAVRLCGANAADAEDLLQEAALRASRKFSSLRDPAAGRAWLFTVLLRTHLNRVRAARSRAETLESDLDMDAFEEALAAWVPSAGPLELLMTREQGERIARALAELPGDLRPVVTLVDLEGFTQREAAAMLGVPEGTVASRLFRARKALRERLAEPPVEAVSGRTR
jgi:RNA polymerase sigma-70 factor (ECF subfamily)